MFKFVSLYILSHVRKLEKYFDNVLKIDFVKYNIFIVDKKVKTKLKIK